MADIVGGAIAMDDAKVIIKRIEKRLKATERKLRDEGDHSETP
jgi:hypothetical protein